MLLETKGDYEFAEAVKNISRILNKSDGEKAPKLVPEKGEKLRIVFKHAVGSGIEGIATTQAIDLSKDWIEVYGIPDGGSIEAYFIFQPSEIAYIWRLRWTKE